MLDCRMRGVIWYQGEGNGGDWKYRLMLPALIEDWRTGFQNPDLAFHIVQLPHAGGWDWGRESQTLTALQGRNTGLAVISDFGGTIHPKVSWASSTERPAGAVIPDVQPGQENQEFPVTSPARMLINPVRPDLPALGSRTFRQSSASPA